MKMSEPEMWKKKLSELGLRDYRDLWEGTSEPGFKGLLGFVGNKRTVTKIILKKNYTVTLFVS